MIRFLFASIVLCSVCQAEIVATVTQAKAITGLVGQRAAGDVTLIDASSKPVIQSVTLVKITTPAKFVDVVARRFVVESGVVKIESATVKEIGTREYLLVGSGVYGVEIVAFDPVSGIDRKMVEVRIDESKPDPKPDPEPEPKPIPDVVPNDYNVGKIAFANAPANDAAMAKQIASWYRVGASKLFGGGGNLADIGRIRDEIGKQFTNKQCKDKATCEQWDKWKAAVSDALVKEQVKRNTFTKQDWFTALVEVASALEAIK